MTKTPTYSSLAILALLQDFVEKHPEDRIAVRALVDHMGEQGLLLLLLVFSLFCAIPLPIPGIHIFLSAPLFYVTIQQMMGRHTLWLPETVLNHTLPRHGFTTLIEKSAPWFTWLERFMDPRLTFITSPAGYRLMGFIALFITCIIVIPLPLTNVVPSLAIALIALGMACRDGLVALIGAAIGLLWCLMWIALAAFLGWAGMKGIYALIFS